MILAIEIGNSQTSFGLWAGEELRGPWTIASRPGRTADELAVFSRAWLEESCAGERIEAAALCSVVPSLTGTMAAYCRRWLRLEPILVEAGTGTGMEVRYEPPSSLGPDRLVGAFAARERYGAPLLVVDFGTATTINAVNASGAFVGGAIAAGLGTTAEALTDAGARLSPIDLLAGAPSRVVGRNTAEAIRSGVIHGHAGLVTGLLRTMEGELVSDSRERPSVVATGGWSSLMAPLLPRVDHRAPQLLLEGLRLLALRHVAAESATRADVRT